jgi:hypothetical protein
MATAAQAIGLAHRAPELIIPEDPEPIGAEQDPAASTAADEAIGEPVETVYIAPDVGPPVDDVYDIAAEDA